MVSTLRVRRHRDAMREQGYRLVQMWVRDTSSPAFVREAHRQSRLEAQLIDPELDAFTEWAATETLKDLPL